MLTPKEKAKELISIHSITILSEVGNYLTINEVKAIAKQCALIAIDEIIKYSEEWDDSNYWQEVKYEIEKL
jgi:hypothetical protein